MDALFITMTSRTCFFLQREDICIKHNFTSEETQRIPDSHVIFIKDSTNYFFTESCDITFNTSSFSIDKIQISSFSSDVFINTSLAIEHSYTTIQVFNVFANFNDEALIHGRKSIIRGKGKILSLDIFSFINYASTTTSTFLESILSLEDVYDFPVANINTSSMLTLMLTSIPDNSFLSLSVGTRNIYNEKYLLTLQNLNNDMLNLYLVNQTVFVNHYGFVGNKVLMVSGINSQVVLIGNWWGNAEIKYSNYAQNITFLMNTTKCPIPDSHINITLPRPDIYTFKQIKHGTSMAVNSPQNTTIAIEKVDSFSITSNQQNGLIVHAKGITSDLKNEQSYNFDGTLKISFDLETKTEIKAKKIIFDGINIKNREHSIVCDTAEGTIFIDKEFATYSENQKYKLMKINQRNGAENLTIKDSGWINCTLKLNTNVTSDGDLNIWVTKVSQSVMCISNDIYLCENEIGNFQHFEDKDEFEKYDISKLDEIIIEAINSEEDPILLEIDHPMNVTLYSGYFKITGHYYINNLRLVKPNLKYLVDLTCKHIYFERVDYNIKVASLISDVHVLYPFSTLRQSEEINEINIDIYDYKDISIQDGKLYDNIMGGFSFDENYYFIHWNFFNTSIKDFDDYYIRSAYFERCNISKFHLNKNGHLRSNFTMIDCITTICPPSSSDIIIIESPEKIVRTELYYKSGLYIYNESIPISKSTIQLRGAFFIFENNESIISDNSDIENIRFKNLIIRTTDLPLAIRISNSARIEANVQCVPFYGFDFTDKQKAKIYMNFSTLESTRIMVLSSFPYIAPKVIVENVEIDSFYKSGAYIPLIYAVKHYLHDFELSIPYIEGYKVQKRYTISPSVEMGVIEICFVKIPIDKETEFNYYEIQWIILASISVIVILVPIISYIIGMCIKRKKKMAHLKSEEASLFD